MKKKNLTEAILNLLENAEEKSSLAIIEELNLENSASTLRSIQRALVDLIEQEKIEAKGNARSRTYSLKRSSGARRTVVVAEKPRFNEVIISSQARDLFNYVSGPESSRSPIGYQIEFLKNYVPNQTHYFSTDEKNGLQELGQVNYQMKPAGTYARDILNKLLIDLSWNSSRLEGNTYTMLETKRLIELGEKAAGKDLASAQMILNHKEAIEYIISISDESVASELHIRSVHALLSDNLLGDPAGSGKLRDIAVGIGGTVYIPLNHPQQIKEYFTIFVTKLNQIENPFEQSLFALIHIAYLQAFEDVNKRTARIVANIPLFKKNLRPLAFIDVEQEIYVKALLGIYEKNDVSLLKELYLWAYKRSSEKYTAVQLSMGTPNPIKTKYRSQIQEIISSLIVNETPGSLLVQSIREKLNVFSIPAEDFDELFKTIEIEIIGLHEGNVARYKVSPNQFEKWKAQQ